MLCRCMCGAPSCRGTMDTKPKRFKDFGRRIEIWWEGDAVFYRGTTLEFHAGSGKHTVLYDDGESETISLPEMTHRSALRCGAAHRWQSFCLSSTIISAPGCSGQLLARQAAWLRHAACAHLAASGELALTVTSAPCCRWLPEDASPNATLQAPRDNECGWAQPPAPAGEVSSCRS